MSLDAFTAARNKVLIDLDVAAARKLLGDDASHLSNEGILAGMHKARIHVVALDIELRRASLRWLKLHGYLDITGGPLPTDIEE